MKESLDGKGECTNKNWTHVGPVGTAKPEEGSF